MSSDIIALDETRFASICHRLAATLPDGWVVRQYLGPTPGNCIAILSPPNQELPDISIKCVGGPVTGFEMLMRTTYNLIAMRQCEMLAAKSETVVDGIPAREIHYRDQNLAICKVYLIRDHVGYSIIASDENELDKELFHKFIESMDWHYEHQPRSLGELFAQSGRGSGGAAVLAVGGLSVILGIGYAIYHFLIR